MDLGITLCKLLKGLHGLPVLHCFGADAFCFPVYFFGSRTGHTVHQIKDVPFGDLNDVLNFGHVNKLA